MQFRGQTHLLNVPLTIKELDPGRLRGAFERAYHERFGIELPEIGAMLVNLKTSIIGRRRPIDPALFAASRERAASLADARPAQRPVWFETGWATTPVYRRERLPLEATIEGPALIEQLDTTTVLEPGSRARLDRLGNLLVEVGA
jgi:N-methylhydantoinase A